MTTADQPSSPAETAVAAAAAPFPLPRVTIQFCTQCKWMLRAAYFAQELLSTFSTSLGEVALQPATGGVFRVEIFFYPPAPAPAPTGTEGAAEARTLQRRLLWDRKAEGGFPETKELKRRVRDAIEPGRDLGHVDREHHRRDPQPAGDVSGKGEERQKDGQGEEGSGLPPRHHVARIVRPDLSNLLSGSGDRGGEQQTSQASGGGSGGRGEVCEDCQ